MLTEAIIKYRDLAKGKCKIQVIGDNGQIFTDGLEGNVLLWLDDQQTLLVARPNNAPNQASAPFDVTLLDYDHIQYIHFFCGDELLKEVFAATGHPNQEKAYNMISKSDVVKASITGSTGDGIEYGHTRPTYEQDIEQAEIEARNPESTEDAGN